MTNMTWGSLSLKNMFEKHFGVAMESNSAHLLFTFSFSFHLFIFLLLAPFSPGLVGFIFNTSLMFVGFT